MDRPVRTANKNEIADALRYIGGFSILIWLPLVIFIAGRNPLELFGTGMSWLSALIFLFGALLANATAVGGGLVFNPAFQLVLKLNGYHALMVAVLAQCGGMTSGSYGWYRKGAFKTVKRSHLIHMGLATVAATAICTLLFLAVMNVFPKILLVLMKIAGIFVSFYVFFVMMRHIREGKKRPVAAAPEVGPGISVPGAPAPSTLHFPGQGNTGVRTGDRLETDRRIFPWIGGGAMLNVSTSVGVGELVFSHLIKYYDSPPRTAIAVGTLLQAISVVTQGIFILFLMGDLILVDLVCIGLLFCMIGGRLAPLVMSSRKVEPFAKPILAYTALSMGLTNAFLLLIAILSA